MASHNQRTTRVSRRGFIGGIGAGAVGAAGAIAHPESAAAQVRPDIETTTRPDRFSRLFGQLPPFVENNMRVQSALRELGAQNGLLDAKDNLALGPLGLIQNPGNNPDNTTTTAGVTFFGQFLDHDITFDATSRLGVATRPERSPNSRTPSFDLDSVYGRGPIADNQLYDPDDRVKFKIEKTSEGGFEDLPRTRRPLGDHPGPAERRARHPRRAAGGFPVLPQQGGGHAARQRRRPAPVAPGRGGGGRLRPRRSMPRRSTTSGRARDCGASSPKRAGW